MLLGSSCAAVYHPLLKTGALHGALHAGILADNGPAREVSYAEQLQLSLRGRGSSVASCTLSLNCLFRYLDRVFKQS